jgi:capsule polysaccharide export protein KpsE/RkpR
LSNNINTEKLSFSLVDYYKIFQKYKKSLLIIVSSTLVVTLITVFFILDPIYLSTGTIKTTFKASGLGGLLSGAGLPDIGELGDLAGASSGAKELALYENILTSRKNVEEAIVKYKLNDDWDYKYMQDAVKNFRENILEIKKDKVAGTMEIGIYDKDPKRAQEIAQFMIDQLNNINSELNVLNAKNNREFIQGRYENIKKELKSAEDSMKVYQDKYGISPDLQVKAAVQSQIQLEIEIKTEEVKLEMLKNILSPDQPEVKNQISKIEALKKELSDVLSSPEEGSNLTLKGKPQVVIDFLRLQRNVEIQNKILTFILPIFEQSKIEEKRNTPSVLVIDTPNLPERKAKPKRLIITFVLVVFAFIFAYFIFVMFEKWKLYKKEIS